VCIWLEFMFSLCCKFWHTAGAGLQVLLFVQVAPCMCTHVWFPRGHSEQLLVMCVDPQHQLENVCVLLGVLSIQAVDQVLGTCRAFKRIDCFSSQYRGHPFLLRNEVYCLPRFTARVCGASCAQSAPL
jgi:hypothetical protein